MKRKETHQTLVRPTGRRLDLRHSVMLALTLLVSLSPGCVQGASSIDDEVRLRGTGPYRGQVLDAATKQPIVGAVVVTVWYYSSSTLAGDRTHFYDALEVLTDMQGTFVVDAAAIERRAPSRTSFPDFIVFKPGYLYFKGWFASPAAMADRRKQAVLGTVELKPVTDRKERLDNLPPAAGLEIPREKVPLFMKALAEERKALGLSN